MECKGKSEGEVAGIGGMMVVQRMKRFAMLGGVIHVK